MPVDKSHPSKTSPSGAPIAACEDEQSCTLVACAACLTEIPADVAMTHEGPDYVQHFCGLDCLARWQRTHSKKED